MNVQASLDQLGAMVRDTYTNFGVDLEGEGQLRAAQVTWLLIHSQREHLPWILGAVASATSR